MIGLQKIATVGGCTELDLSPHAIEHGYNAFLTTNQLHLRGILSLEGVLLCKDSVAPLRITAKCKKVFT